MRQTRISAPSDTCPPAVVARTWNRDRTLGRQSANPYRKTVHWLASPFSSHELDLFEPDPEVLGHVAETTNRTPGRILFLDDNQLNVDAAGRAGWRSDRVAGIDEARAALAGHGLVS